MTAEQPEQPAVDESQAAETVTVEQEAPAAEPEHDFPEQDVAAPAMVPASAANESPTLPPGAVTAAARAHALYSHLVTVARAAQAEIERYVPPDVLQAAEREAGLFVRSIL